MYYRKLGSFISGERNHIPNHLNIFFKLNLSRFSSSITPTNRKVSTKSEPSEVDRRDSQADLSEDYVKYFKPKKDRMKSFLQGHVKRVKLRGPNYNDYCKFKLRPFY